MRILAFAPMAFFIWVIATGGKEDRAEKSRTSLVGWTTRAPEPPDEED